MLDCWEGYIRPRYKKAIGRWNKDTGGGDGKPSEFINFCAGDRWLVWVFCKDLEAGFLLASSAGGRMPNHLQVESGFENMSPLDDSGTKRLNTVAAEDELGEV